MADGVRGQTTAMRRPAALLVAVVSVLSFAVSCSSDDDDSTGREKDPTTVNKESDGEGTPGVDAQTDGTTDGEFTEREE